MKLDLLVYPKQEGAGGGHDKEGSTRTGPAKLRRRWPQRDAKRVNTVPVTLGRSRTLEGGHLVANYEEPHYLFGSAHSTW